MTKLFPGCDDSGAFDRYFREAHAFYEKRDRLNYYRKLDAQKEELDISATEANLDCAGKAGDNPHWTPLQATQHEAATYKDWLIKVLDAVEEVLLDCCDLESPEDYEGDLKEIIEWYVEQVAKRTQAQTTVAQQALTKLNAEEQAALKAYWTEADDYV